MLLILQTLNSNCYQNISWEINQTEIMLKLANKTESLWVPQGECSKSFTDNIRIQFTQDHQIVTFIYKSDFLPSVIKLKSWNLLTYTQDVFVQILMSMNKVSNITIQLNNTPTYILGHYENVNPMLTQTLFDVKSESKVGIIVGVIITAALIIAIVAFVVIRKRNARNKKQQSKLLQSGQDQTEEYYIEVNSIQEAQELFDEMMSQSRRRKRRANKLQSIQFSDFNNQLQAMSVKQSDCELPMLNENTAEQNEATQAK